MDVLKDISQVNNNGIDTTKHNDKEAPTSPSEAVWGVSAQAGTELAQTQYKQGLDFTLIFCRFVFLDLVW